VSPRGEEYSFIKSPPRTRNPQLTARNTDTA
jgi:hypothetical protein